MKLNGFIQGMVTLAMVLLMSLDLQGTPPAKYSPAGAWEYIVPGVPEGYDRGVMIITESEDGLAIEIGPSKDYLVKAEKVEYSNKQLSFIVYVEYEEVKISGEFKDENFEGTVSYVEGVFDINASKVPESKVDN
jgi:hypothetical protein